MTRTYRRDVQPTARHVGSDEDVSLARLELPQRPQPFRLAHLPVQADRLDPRLRSRRATRWRRRLPCTVTVGGGSYRYRYRHRHRYRWQQLPLPLPLAAMTVTVGGSYRYRYRWR